jgi:peptidoglycan/xylan/chitin deacetylase (PgdA/CDA1 family)
MTFDVDGEAGWIAMDPANAHRPGVLSQGSYGPKVGLPLILKVLERHHVRATFFVPGVIVENHRSRIQEVLDNGHELAMHGYTHTPPALLDPAQERAELDRAFEILTSTGAAVEGYRSPSWDISDVTLDLLEEKGLKYTSQFMDDIKPYRHEGRKLIELPIQWIIDDWPHFAWSGTSDSARNIRGTAEVETIWKEEFDAMRELSACYVLTMHPQVIGRPSRVKMFERVLEYIQSQSNTWIATCSELAAHADKELRAAGAVQ